MKDELIAQNVVFHKENFGIKDEIITCAVPASLITLGDHTHYNDGIILSCAVNRYAVSTVNKREDNQINISFGDCELNYNSTLNEFSENNIRCGQVAFGPLLNLLREDGLLINGFNCSIRSNIPASIGLGNVSAHQISLLLALNIALNLKLNDEQVVDISRRAELNFVGKISNRAHHRTVLNCKSDAFFYNDLRTDTNDVLDIKNRDFKLIICDTGKVISNISDICNERISECKVGVDGLRLYIWGIKNLRDINLEFLEKHFHMIPKKVYSRVFYNVQERIRVEKATKLLSDNDYNKFGELINESHFSLRRDYEIGSEDLDFLVNEASKINGVIASKMISCSPIESTFNFVENNKVSNFIEEINTSYNEKYGKKLTFYSLNIVNGFNK